MQPVQRASVRSARQIRPHLQRQCRRNASDSSKGSSHGSAHDAPANETMGPGFYIAIAALPASVAIFQATRGENAYLTRTIRETYNSYKDQWAERNALHTHALEQAAADRVLFLNETAKGPHRNIDLRFPEQFNSGAPWNVPAGHGSVNLDQVVAKYEKQAYDDQAKKLQQVKENKVPVEQPYETFARSNAPVRPAVPVPNLPGGG